MTRDEAVAGSFQAIQRGSKSFRAASRLFDRQTRERAWLLYCWCRHCDDLCDGQSFGQDSGSKRSVAELREQSLRALAGAPNDELPLQALACLTRECPLPQRLVFDHLDGFALDEAGWSPANEEELIRYCYHVAGAVGCMMAVLMGVPADDTNTLERAADLGIAFQLSNIVRDLSEDHRAGRCYLPADWLAEAGLQRESLFAPGSAPALQRIVDRLVVLIDRYEASARRGVERLPFRSRLAVLSALRIYGAIGRRVGSLGPAAWDRRVAIGKTRKLAMLLPSFTEAIALGRRQQ
jgi:15-cis-phytoene synthase